MLRRREARVGKEGGETAWISIGGRERKGGQGGVRGGVSGASVVARREILIGERVPRGPNCFGAFGWTGIRYDVRTGFGGGSTEKRRVLVAGRIRVEGGVV